MPPRRSPLRLLPGLILLLPVVLPSPAEARAAAPEAATDVPVHDLWEARVNGDALPEGAARANPFHPGEILLDAVVTPPSGEAYRVPLFWGQDFVRERSAAHAERLQRSESAPAWRLRIAPRETGRHAVRILCRLGEGEPRLVGETAFLASEPRSRGAVRVDPERPAALLYDDGTRFPWIGHNLAWVTREEGTFGFDRELDLLAASGGNAARVWLCSWGLSLDRNRPWSVDLADAWRLDHVFRAAQQRGIVLLLTIDNFHDFRENFRQSPFHAGNGGPCATRTDFFLSGEARTQYRARLRYLVARYAAFRSLLAWELWNEMNYALSPLEKSALPGGAAAARKLLVDWTAGAAGDLRALDSSGHPITTSLGDNAVWPSLWALPEMDLVQIHGYIDRQPWLRPPVEEDAAAFVLALHGRAAAFGKPALVSEFGYAGDGSVSPLNPRDPDGIAFHNAVWAGAFAAGGTPFHWWWDNYLGPYGLTKQYRPLSELLAALPGRAAPEVMREETDGLRVLALRTEAAVLLWIQNRRHTWHRVLEEGEPPVVLRDVRIRLEGFAPGDWEASWIDPRSGRTLQTEIVGAPDGRLRLAPPDFTTDLACRLHRRPDAAPPRGPR